MQEKIFDKRLLVAMTDEMVSAIDNLRKLDPGFPSRSEIVRRAVAEMVKRRLPDWEQTDD